MITEKQRRNEIVKKWQKDHPEEYRAHKKKWRDKNREHVRNYNKKWYSVNSKRITIKDRKRKYGLTQEQYDEMFLTQDKRCGICKSDDPKSKKGWVIDHCHNTGIIRGILCHPCNLMLGNAKDNIETLQSGIKYLEKFPK